MLTTFVLDNMRKKITIIFVEFYNINNCTACARFKILQNIKSDAKMNTKNDDT